MEAGRRPDGSQAGQVAAHCRQEGIAPGAVDGPHPPQVVVEVAPRQEVGEGQLLEARRPAVRRVLGRRDRLDETLRHDQPTETQSRGQGLAGRPGVDDVLRREPLERADRLAVVAVLGVVVWLRNPAAEVVLSVALPREATSPRWKQVVHPTRSAWMHHLEVHETSDIDGKWSAGSGKPTKPRNDRRESTQPQSFGAVASVRLACS